MYPYIHIILPSYMTLSFLGGFFTLLLVYSRTIRFEVAFPDFLKLFVLCAFGGFLGSKILFIITRIPWFLYHPEFSNLLHLVLHSGYVFYGGLFGVLLTIQLYAGHSKTYENRQLFNLTAPAIPLFHCFGRIGCLMAGCCYGFEFSTPIKIGDFALARFPTQPLEAFFEALLFMSLLVLERHRQNSFLLPVYLTMYASFRFVLEFFRGDTVRGIFFGFSTSQWISIAILAYYIIKAFKQYHIQAIHHRP